MTSNDTANRPGRVLVTGGAGFIGSHIVDALVADGYEVSVVDNLHTGRRENVNPSARFHHVDIRDRLALSAVFETEHPQFICHQAALANVRDSVEHPEEYAMVNVIGTLHLLELARAHRVRKFVMASTGGAIYGDAAKVPTDEDSIAHPLDPYGVSKLSGEHYLFSYRHNHGLDYCALRYGNVYGPRQDTRGEAGVVAIFSGRMLGGERATINGDGRQERDFTYVGDVARANLLALRQGSGIYNIGTGAPTDINTLFERLAELADYRQPAAHGSHMLGEVRASCLDPARAQRDLGWKAEVPLAAGLASTLAWYRERMPAA